MELSARRIVSVRSAKGSCIESVEWLVSYAGKLVLHCICIAYASICIYLHRSTGVSAMRTTNATPAPKEGGFPTGTSVHSV